MDRTSGEDGSSALAGLLPRRYPFPLVDAVLDVDGAHLVALTVVARAQASFRGHFPGRPILPGVLVCEALVQAGALLLRHQEALPAGTRLALIGADRMRFRRLVVPGDEMRLEVSLVGCRGHVWRLRGSAFVGDEAAADGDILAAVKVLAA